jgi:putative acetyltransferase
MQHFTGLPFSSCHVGGVRQGLCERSSWPSPEGLRLREVRVAAEDDIDAIVEIANAVVTEERWVSREPGGTPFMRGDFLPSLHGKDRALFVACEGPEIVGFLRVRIEADGFHQFGMMVRAGRRGCGFGKALVIAAIGWAREHGIPALYLTVYAHNEAAQALYRALGFVETATLPAHSTRRNGDVWNAIVMMRRFAPSGGG